MIDNDANVNACYFHGNTVLMYSIISKKEDKDRDVIYGTDINDTTFLGLLSKDTDIEKKSVFEASIKDILFSSRKELIFL